MDAENYRVIVDDKDRPFCVDVSVKNTHSGKCMTVTGIMHFNTDTLTLFFSRSFLCTDKLYFDALSFTNLREIVKKFKEEIANG